MSHFTCIKTQIKDKSILLEALEILQYEVKQDQELVVGNVYHAQNHPIVQADVCIAKDVGFRWNDQDKIYELVTDLETWNQPIPPERLIEKVTQQYAKVSILSSIEEEGFTVEKESSNVDNTIELVVTRWR
tara:strand:+ start:584 stop:976 length:393 start_codon:yes stop_codon:yes gene_type:complete